MLFEIHALMQNTHDQNIDISGDIKYDMGLVFISP